MGQEQTYVSEGAYLPEESEEGEKKKRDVKPKRDHVVVSDLSIAH